MSGLTAAGYALDPDSEKWAQAFHEAYERLAPTFGYETRRESAVPWADVPAANKALMTAVAGYVVAAAIASVLDVDRVAAALHSRCVEEYAHARKVDPTRMMTQHGPDAHHDAAARVIAALTGGQG